ncbi:hypothetical protein Mgra_00008282 [Meloidogyne graminicola]|uniref:BPTI/Kunitz inhibitor domain-containing protein n=1 Tax=Meloidogyne graminicola TaxID=189291 RepID=A0A8S9ZG27_9BILA|nr:hypothetical protein Mgra_00008282 [Meloidogyne graminicola]
MISLIISLYILFFLVSGEENQDNSILTTFKNDIIKNMTKITFYGTLPSTTHYINLPIELSQVRQANSFSSFPTSKQTFYSRADICKQPQQVGSGPYRIPRWFYNSEASKCVPFYWSGCCANSNNFANQEHCQNTCEGMLQINDPGNDWFLVQHRVPEGKMDASNAKTKVNETLTTANPCALGSSQFLLCQPTTPSTCSNQQFCHVGDSPITTVCCNKQTEVNVCQQPLNSGTGSSTLQRWFFYAPAGQCQTFTYRGLQGNENNFLSRIDCEQISNPCSFGSPLRDSYYCHIGGDALTSLCCPEIGGNPCLQPCNPGQGFYQLTRWYWYSAAGCCRQFTYKGQKGNQNNFISLEECNNACYGIQPNPCRQPIQLPLVPCQPGPEACERRNDLYCHIGSSQETTVCCPIDQGDRCQLPIELGEGTAQLPSGLKGNQNNFLTLEECELACLPNPCPSGTPFVGADGRIQSCAVSTSMNTCPNNYWCHVGANTASTVCCPDANPNPCQLPMSTGEGFAQLERFYFDLASKTCKNFYYKGLKGNQNNFLSLRACQLACLPLDNPCIGQPAKSESGQVFFCSASNRDTCPVNFWCHLGAVPETTVCCPGATNPCSVPLAPGTGNAGLARWYYNADERQCISFQYNGKRGNQNNFLTSEECQNICPAALCLLSIDRGSCSGKQTRYAYSREKSQCVPFEYSGCGGNLNNFLNMQECQQICSSVRF